MRILFASLALLTLSACGLSPMYAGGGSGAIAQSLAGIEVAPIEGRAGWLVRSALEERLGLPPVELLTIGSAIELDQFKTMPEEDREYDLVLLGRMHMLKGVLDLPDVWARVREQRPEARLVVIGEGPHRADVQRIFAERGMSNSVTFTGGIGEEEKNELLAKSRVGLSLSSEEGWGLAVNEYLACALPVVAYDLPVFDEIFPSLLDSVPLGDSSAASQAILELLDDPKARQQQGQIGYNYVQRYDYRAMAREELNHLRAICGLY